MWSYQICDAEVSADLSLLKIFGLVLNVTKLPLSAFLKNVHDEDVGRLRLAIEHVVTGKAQTLRVDYRVVRLDGTRQIAARGYAEKDARGEVVRLHGLVVDVTDRQRAEMALAAEKAVVESIARDKAKEETLALVCRGIEAQSQKGMLVSALLLDAETSCLRHGAAPSLPEAYNRAIDGLRIGPGVGSCGTAAFTAKPIFVEDISTHPYWAEFKSLAAEHGLGSCSSFPVISSQGEVLGTLAMYYPSPYMPTDDEMHLMRTATYLAGIVMERARERERLKQAHDMLVKEKEAQVRVMHHLRVANRAVTAIIGSDSVAEMSGHVLDLLVSSFQATIAGVWIVGARTNLFDRVAQHGIDGDTAMLAETIDAFYTTNKLGWVARFGQPYAGGIAHDDLQFDVPWLQQRGLTYAAIYPFAAGGRTLGIAAYFASTEQPPAALPEVMATVGSVAGISLLSRWNK